MALITTFLIGGILFIAFIFLLFRQKRPKNFPPGPLPLPFFGNLFQAGLKSHKKFIQMGKKYGPIFAFDFGSYRAVVINDLQLIKQCLNDPLCSGRPKLQFFIERSGGSQGCTRGIATTDGTFWSEQRRFAIRNLRDFGLGKSSMEGIIQDEVIECIQLLRNDVGKSISTKGRFNAAVLNALWRIVSGVKTSQDDPNLLLMLEIVYRGISNTSLLSFFFPLLTKWFPKLTGYEELMSHSKPLDDLIRSVYNNHKESLVPGQPRDFMDTIVEEIHITTDPNSSFYGEEAVNNIMKSLADLFIGGSETTSTTLEWFCLLMILNPDVQEKVWQEIEKVIGTSRWPKLADRANMPYLECVLMETLRISSILPFAVYHNTMEEVHIANYTLPKNTLVVPNLYAVHHSEEIWGDPEVFRPERFLQSDGNPNRSHEAFLPFAPGKRFCIGEKLARDELFLFTTSLFQQFKMTSNPKFPKPGMESKMALVLYPAPHELIMLNRNL